MPSVYEAVAQLGEGASVANVINPLQVLADFVDGLAGLLDSERLPSATDQVKGLFAELAESVEGDANVLSSALQQLVEELSGEDVSDRRRESDDD